MPDEQFVPQNIMVTADNVVFSSKFLNEREVSLYVLLITRKNDPFAGLLALPGGFVENEEWVQQSAQRELAEETGLVASPFKVMTARTDPKRDPRGRVISFPFLYTVEGCPAVKGADDAVSAQWVDIEDLALDADMTPLAFDHRDIIREALDNIVELTISLNQMESAPEFGALMNLRQARSAQL